jgi:hypothetical protein
LGQRQDFTAVCVAEVEKRGEEEYTDQSTGQKRKRGGVLHYIVRHLERLPLGTSYPAVAERLAAIQQGLQERQASATWWVDATGVGGPVVDLLRQAGVYPTPVYLTAGDKAVREHGELRLPKALLVSRLQVLLQSGRIHLPQTQEAAALVDELLAYEIRVDEAAQATFGAFRVGAHDDLATALGLACWGEPITGKIFF